MKTQPKKSVTLNPIVVGIEIMSIYDYTSREVSASWYNNDDMYKITNRCFKVIRKVEVGDSLRINRYCTRGLEGYFSVASISKTRNRSTAFMAVMAEQSMQRIGNSIDDQAIADAYRNTTRSCHLWARVVGKCDEEAAQVIHLYPTEQSDDVDDSDDDLTRTTGLASGLPRPPNQQIAWKLAGKDQLLRATVA
ncbi:unnamed protein product [Cylindrotheca closterium]|uniref:Uncharacterized protein n=1 Tax=Cylindrotheca closterium TaxID=2856 RepID=A0AAD2CUJ4_9STRA|nr:unnamed protein product [Cylindrotheca closterium]